MEPKIPNISSRKRGMPSRIGDLPAPRFAPKGEAVTQVFTNLFSQYLNRIFIQRHSPRRSVLGLVQPGGLAVKIDPAPFQTRDFSRAATCRQGKPHQGRKVWRT